MSDRPKKMLTVQEVGALLSVHPQTVRGWAMKGLLRHFLIPKADPNRPGGHRRFDPADVEAFRDSRMRGGQP